MKHTQTWHPGAILFFLYGLLVLSGCQKEDKQIEIPELHRLREAIINKDKYRQIKENTLKQEKKLLNSAKTDQDRYTINRKITDIYNGYLSDSAFVYLKKNMVLAKKLHREDLEYETLIYESNILTATGLFAESKTILDSIRTKVPEAQRFSFNIAQETLYNNLYEYNNRNDSFALMYKKWLDAYYDKGFQNFQDPIFKNLFLYNKYRLEDNWPKAKISIDAFIQDVKAQKHTGSNFLAIGYYCKSNVEGHLGNTALEEKYLALSALQDIENVNLENRSLQELSYLLYKKGRYDTAYFFLNSAIEDASQYNARFRSFQISQLQPIIGKAYNDQINKSNNHLRIALGIISFMIFLLAAVIYLVVINLREVDKSRKKLKKVNGRLFEANRVKEEYVAFFVQQSSLYLEKFEQYKKQIALRIATGQLKKLEGMLNSKKGDIIDINEFYRNFDTAFLRIYPNFVQEINTFVKPDDQYSLLPGTLNNELRIFALIRLGIHDTQQISGFLRYTVQTIYNYKSKVKQKLVIPPEDFEGEIMKIGAFQA